jgi:hypothetical protein
MNEYDYNKFSKAIEYRLFCYSARGEFFNANLDTDFWVRDLKQTVLFDFYLSFLCVMETEASNSEKGLSFDFNDLLYAL